MNLLEKFHTPPAILDSIERYGVNPVGITVEVGGCATEGIVDGRHVVLAGTNNYLGMTYEPRCIAAAVAATQKYGTGTTGSRMATGTYSEHQALETELADCFEARSAIVFTTGYQANLGMISALVGPDDVVLLDADSGLLAGNVFGVYQERLPADVAQFTRLEALPTASAMLRLAPALAAAGGRVDAALALPLYVRDKVAFTTQERDLAKALKAQAALPLSN